MQEIQETWIRSLGQEDSPGGGNSNPLQYSCLENPLVRGAWRAAVHGVAKSRPRQSNEQYFEGWGSRQLELLSRISQNFQKIHSHACWEKKKKSAFHLEVWLAFVYASFIFQGEFPLWDSLDFGLMILTHLLFFFPFFLLMSFLPATNLQVVLSPLVASPSPEDLLSIKSNSISIILCM